MSGTWRSAVLLALHLLSLSLFAGAAAQDVPNEEPSPGHVGAPAEPVAARHLYDYANLLDDSQEASVESDADRLQRFGVPAVILVQASDMAPDDAAAYAGEIATQWGVETSDGAADGLVMLVVVGLSEEKHAYTVMAWGHNALPHFGIDQEVATRIHERWLDGYVQEGLVYDGVLSSLRRLVYHSIYDPAPESGLAGGLALMHRVVGWLAPMVALAVVALTVARRTRWVDIRTLGGADLATTMTWGPPALALALAVIAIWTESGTGVLSALILGGIALGGWVRRDSASDPPTAVRQVAR